MPAIIIAQPQQPHYQPPIIGQEPWDQHVLNQRIGTAALLILASLILLWIIKAIRKQ